MPAQNQPVFEAILVRPSSWRRLGGSTFGVTAVYGAMLAGIVFLSKEVPPPAKKARKELVVTLFDAPRVASIRSLGEAGGDEKGALGSTDVAPAIEKAQEDRAPRPTVNTKAKTSKETKAIPNEKPTSTAGAVVQKETPLPAPAAGGDAITPSAQEVTSKPSTTAGAGTSGTGAGGAASGQGGAGTGAGTGANGAGIGNGAGTKAGMVSGDATVLPFMDGMTRPELVTQTPITYTREARDANVSGLVLLKCVIGTTGGLTRCRVLKGIPQMDQAVLSEVSKWRYSPVIYQGKPVAVDYTIPVRLVPPP